MLRIEKNIELTTAFDLSLIAPVEDIMFFDIETTGLSSWKSGLYLIGLLTYDDGWKLIQYFCEDVADEVTVLENFFTLLSSKKVLISFNGDGFDIPFLAHMTEQYGLPCTFDGVESYDILKKIRPLKKLLGLENLKLKTVEKFLGIGREDRYSGGELIYVYEEYVRMGRILKGGLEDTELNKKLRQKLLETLLLHNAEDVKNLPQLLPLLAYDLILRGAYDLTGAFCTEHEGKRFLDLRFSLPLALPKPFALSDGTFSVSFSAAEGGLLAELFEGEVKYFFADVKNYYYLPLEDQAVHRSVGEFVDKKSRRRATAATCYQRHAGVFLPEPEPAFTPVFYREYKGKLRYAAFSEELLSDGDALRRYSASVLSHLLREQRESAGND